MRIFTQRRKPTQQMKSLNSTTHRRTFFEQNHAVRSIMHLQCTIGNHAVQRWLQNNAEKHETGSVAAASTHTVHDFSRVPVHANIYTNMQAKLRVSHPGDEYEQEADRMANQVMQMQEPFLDEQVSLKRLKTEGEQSGGAGRTEVPSRVNEVPHSAGLPMDAGTWEFMEPRFGRDFSRVRIHTKNQSSETAHHLNTRAFTIGQDIYFKKGEYNPKHTAGRKFIAHELTHVLQNRNIISRYHVTYRRALLEPDLSTSEVHTRSAIQTHGRYTIINHFPLLGPDVFRFRFRFNFMPNPDRLHVRVRQGSLYTQLPGMLRPPPPQMISSSFSGQDLVFVVSIPLGSEWSIQLDDPPPSGGRKIISWGCRRCW
jgi:hypothetical protein